MSRSWDVAQLKCRAIRTSRNWEFAQLKCRANKMSLKWMSRRWDVALEKSRANGISPSQRDAASAAQETQARKAKARNGLSTMSAECCVRGVSVAKISRGDGKVSCVLFWRDLSKIWKITKM